MKERQKPIRDLFQPSKMAMSYADVARQLGCSKQNVQCLERAALKKCRAWCDANGFDFADMLNQFGEL